MLLETFGSLLVSSTGTNIATADGLPVYARKATDENGNTIIELFTEADEVYFNKDCHNMFFGLSNLTYLHFFEKKINTSLLSNIKGFFNGSYSFKKKNEPNTANKRSNSYTTIIKKLDLSRFDTRNITDMSNMFSYLYYVTKLDLSSLAKIRNIR